MTGKEKCTLLRNIRMQLAQNNKVSYNPVGCAHIGECRGTCYGCDAEVEELTSKIIQMKKSGQVIRWAISSVGDNVSSSPNLTFQPKDDILFGHMFGNPRLGRVKAHYKDKNNTFPLIGIERLRINSDGPGVRALIAVHGCPLNCKYCINPHSANDSGMWDVYTPQEVYAHVKKDAIYYRSTNGGITFGGGEPMMYPAFINIMDKLLPKGLNRWCQTSLNVPLENILACESAIDHFAVDIKALDPDVYRAYTGGELQRVLDNLEWLAEKRGTDAITVRIPIIPGFTSEEDQLKAVVFFTQKGFTNIQKLIYIT